jgi:hypothetical protein
MDKADIRKGLRVVFAGPSDGAAPLFDPSGHKLVGKPGIIVYGISEDIFCYPDDPNSDMVWVAFEGDRLPRRQVAAAWLEPVL